MPPLVALTLVCCVAYSFEVIFGLAGTILMIPILSLFYDVKTLVIYSLLPQILTALVALILSPKSLQFRTFLSMLAFAFLGALLGLYLFSHISSDLFQNLLATLITLAGIYMIFSPQLKTNHFVRRMLDTMAGVSQTIFGISGPIVMTRLLNTFEDKTTVRNHALAFFLSLNVVRFGGYLWNQEFTPEIYEMMYVSAPLLLACLLLAHDWHFKVNETVFRKVVAVIIVVSGILLFFK